MQGPGYDQESTPGLVAAGATVIVFTTGRGTTIGNAIAPVIKLASNTPVFERMPHDIDLSAGGVIDGERDHRRDLGREGAGRLPFPREAAARHGVSGLAMSATRLSEMSALIGESSVRSASQRTSAVRRISPVMTLSNHDLHCSHMRTVITFP